MAARASAAAATSKGATGGTTTRAGVQAAAASSRATSGGDGNGGRAAAEGIEVDEEGFQTVRGGAWRRQRAAAARAEAESGAEARGKGGPTDDGGQGDAAGEGATADTSAESPEAEDGAPSAAELHQAWLEEVAVVRKLRQQGLAADHPAMAAACSARDSAEARWRDAKDPAPPAVRLSRAQAKLDRAVALQEDSRLAIVELERAHEAKLEELRAKHEENTERVRLRRRQLGEIQEELAGGGSGARARARQGQAVQEVRSVLCGTVAPTIAALVEQLDSSAPAWGVLNGLLSTIANSSAILEGTVAPQPPAQSYHIGEDEEGWEGGGRGGGGDVSSEWSESHELRAEGNCWDQQEGHGGDQGDAGGGGSRARDEDRDADHPMGTGAWWEGSRTYWEAGARWEACGHGKWARSRPSWADSWEEERQRGDQEDALPPAARRRLEPTQPQPAQPRDAREDGEGQGGAADDPERRRQQHNERIQRVISAAIDAGVQPLTSSGEELYVLDADQLDAWATEHLDTNGTFW